MSQSQSVSYIDNKAASDPDKFVSVRVDAQKVLDSWKNSLYSFEWLEADGTIKSFENLNAAEADKRRAVDSTLNAGEPIQRPVLGIGLQDNIEIGSCRAEFLTLAALGYKEIEVHIPKSCESDFKPFLA